jgi:hypothetical protein
MELTAHNRTRRTWAPMGHRYPAVCSPSLKSRLHTPLANNLFRFHVDMGSKLYYDPTVITESLRSQHPELDALPQPTDLVPQSPATRSPQVHRGSISSNQFGNPRNMPPFNGSIPPGAFYNNPHEGPMSVPPDMRRSTRASRPVPLPGVGIVDGSFGMSGY